MIRINIIYAHEPLNNSLNMHEYGMSRRTSTHNHTHHTRWIQNDVCAMNNISPTRSQSVLYCTVSLMRLRTLPVTGPVKLVTGGLNSRLFLLCRYISTRGNKLQTIAFHLCIPTVILQFRPVPHCMLVVPQKQSISKVKWVFFHQ